MWQIEKTRKGTYAKKHFFYVFNGISTSACGLIFGQLDLVQGLDKIPRCKICQRKVSPPQPTNYAQQR